MPWTDLTLVTKTRVKVWEYINALIGNAEYNKSQAGGGSITQDSITRFEVANGSDADHDIDFSGGQCADSTNDHYLEDVSGMTKRIDAVWSAGDGNGGLFSGASLSAYSWYYPYILEKDSDDSIDYGFDDNIIGTNIPSDYTHFRKLRGAFLTDASSNILGFSQIGNWFFFNNRILDVNDSSPGTSRNTAQVSVPPNFIGKFKGSLSNSGVAYIHIQGANENNYSPTSGTLDLRVTSDSSKSCTEIFRLVDSSSNIFYRSTDGSVTNFFIATLGFYDDGEYYL